jgi:hypothetical protein
MAWQASTARQFITDPSELANADAQMYARIYPPEAAPGLGQQAQGRREVQLFPTSLRPS